MTKIDTRLGGKNLKYLCIDVDNEQNHCLASIFIIKLLNILLTTI